MAVKIKRITRGTKDLNLTSVSDIVFLMLIYFMVVCIFQQDIGLPFVLPAEQEQTEVVKIRESNIAELVIDASNNVSLDDVPIAVHNVKEALVDRLTANPKLVVMLKTHPDADYGTMVDVLDEVRMADCKKMALKLLEV
jgi:biopolymer transport protein ExbD